MNSHTAWALGVGDSVFFFFGALVLVTLFVYMKYAFALTLCALVHIQEEKKHISTYIMARYSIDHMPIHKITKTKKKNNKIKK